jgi:hypothetical protein
VAPFQAGGIHAQEAEQKALVSGWYEGREVQYYDFGTNTPLDANNSITPAPIWVLIHGMNEDGTPDLVEGQHNIVDVLPGEDGYSDLWQVIFVTVPEDYEPESIRSADELQEAGFEQTPTDMLVNCPIVPEGTTLEGGEEIVQGWARGEEVYYFDFGQNPATVAPIWVLIHGMNADGTPDVVEGQQNIIDTVPGDPDYTAFWRVNMVTVPEGYEPNSLRSAQDVLESGYEITETDMVVNCPVVEVASAPADVDTGSGDVTQVPSAGSGGAAAGGAAVTWPIIALLLASGVAIGGGGLAFKLRRS